MTKSVTEMRAEQVAGIITALRDLELSPFNCKQIEQLIDMKHAVLAMTERAKWNVFDAVGPPSFPLPLGFHHPKHTGFHREPIRAAEDEDNHDDIGFLRKRSL